MTFSHWSLADWAIVTVFVAAGAWAVIKLTPLLNRKLLP